MGLVTLPSTLVAHTPAQAADVMGDLNAIVNQVNGNLDQNNIKDGGVTAPKLASALRARVNSSVSRSLATGTTGTMIYDGEDEDTDNMVTLGTNADRITVQTAGVYVVEALVSYAFAGDSARRVTELDHRRGGSTIRSVIDSRVNVGPAGGGGATFINLTLIAVCAVADFFVITGFQDSGAGVTWSANLQAVRVGSL